MTTDRTIETDRAPQHPALDLWARRVATIAVAGVAAYASYQHQRDFALVGGVDLTTARLWPFSVDGLLVLSTAGLLRDVRRTGRRARMFLWAAFAAGIIVSLAANIVTAPSMSWAPILVAGWPPVALLLGVELLGHRRQRDSHHAEREPERGNEIRTETPAESKSENQSRPEAGAAVEKVITLAESRLSRHTAEEVMWQHYQRAISAGLTAPDRRRTGRRRRCQQLRAGGSAEVAAQRTYRPAVYGNRAVSTERRRASVLDRCSCTDGVCWRYDKTTFDARTAEPAGQSRRGCQLGEHQ